MNSKEYSDLKWEYQYNRLNEFIVQNGRLPHYREGNGVGKWLSRQRTFYRSGSLNQEHKEKLKKSGVCWIYDQARREINNEGDDKSCSE